MGPPLPVPSHACEGLVFELDALNNELAILQDDIRNAESPAARQAIERLLQAQLVKVQAKKKELNDCMAQNDLGDLSVTFNGTATLTTSSPLAKGPFTTAVTLGLLFSIARTSVAITSFPPMTFTLQTPLGNDVTTITSAGSAQGPFARAGGAIQMHVTLLFAGRLAGNSTLPLFLTTASIGNLQGTTLDRNTGRLVLVGTGTLQSGSLGGNTVTVAIDGTLSPLP